MALVIANQGKPELLSLLLIQTTIPNAFFYMFLYTNEYTPVANSVMSDFDKPTYQGYADALILRSSWGQPAINQGKGQSIGGLTGWAITEDETTISGYGFYSAVTGNLLWAEAFPAPRVFDAGDNLYIIPQMTDDTDPNPLS